MKDKILKIVAIIAMITILLGSMFAGISNSANAKYATKKTITFHVAYVMPD